MPPSSVTVRRRSGVTGGQLERRGFTGDGDTPDVTLNADNGLTSPSLSLPGGVLFTSKIGATGPAVSSYDHPSVRGDLVLTTDGNPGGFGFESKCA